MTLVAYTSWQCLRCGHCTPGEQPDAARCCDDMLAVRVRVDVPDPTRPVETP